MSQASKQPGAWRATVARKLEERERRRAAIQAAADARAAAAAAIVQRREAAEQAKQAAIDAKLSAAVRIPLAWAPSRAHEHKVRRCGPTRGDALYTM